VASKGYLLPAPGYYRQAGTVLGLNRRGSVRPSVGPSRKMIRIQIKTRMLLVGLSIDRSMPKAERPVARGEAVGRKHLEYRPSMKTRT